MATIRRILNPAALDVPAIWSLFEGQFADNPLCGRPEHLKESIANDIAGDAGVFIAWKDARPVGLAYITLPSGAWSTEPTWVAWYSADKDKQVARDLADAGIAYLAENGYTSFRAFNGSDKPDSVWARSFRRVTKSGKRLGGIMQFDVKG